MARKRKSWYSINAQADARAAEILVYGDIGESWSGDTVTAKQFVKDVAAIDADTLTVRVNSFGGSVPDGIAIYNAIRRHPAQVTVAIDGMALSIASLIAMAGDRVEMASNAVMMIHAPWGAAVGNAAYLRDTADVLDTWAQAMATSYAEASSMSQPEALALLQDGADHWYTAEEALAAGLVDEIVAPTAEAVAASFNLSRFNRSLPAALRRELPAAAAAQPAEDDSMPANQQPSAAPVTPAATIDTDAIRAAALAEDKDRRAQIRGSFARFADREGVRELQTICEDDLACSPDAANAKLLAHLGANAEPVAGSYVVQMGEDERDKFRAAGTTAILARAGVRDERGLIKASGDNPLRGSTLVDVARACLARGNVRTDGMDRMQLVAAAFTQGTSDFPVLLESAMHKALQSAYAIAPDTWSTWCSVGTVSDFRAHKRYRVGSLANLDAVTELGEFRNKTIPDGEAASVTAATKGNIINISRQAIINDDLGAFVGLAAMLGRAARRTIEADVYALLAANPTMADGYALFSTEHGNLVTSGAVPSVDTIDAARRLMAVQKDPSGNDYLDIRPAFWVGPMALGGAARVCNDAQYDPDTASKLQRPNLVRGIFSAIIDTPRLTGNPWYVLASPMDAPVIEVAFLDGNQAPYLETEAGFEVDGARYKVRLDYGVAVVDYRGAVCNDGA